MWWHRPLLAALAVTAAISLAGCGIQPLYGTTAGGSRLAAAMAGVDITPIPGEDYSAVPADGAIAGRQWVVEKLREYTEDAPAARLHRRDCWQARDSHQRITTEDAVDRLSRQAIAVCDICRPDRALRRLCRATLFLAPAASPVGGGHFTPRCCRRPCVPLRHLSDLLRGLRGYSEHRPVDPAGRRHVTPPRAVRLAGPPPTRPVAARTRPAPLATTDAPTSRS